MFFACVLSDAHDLITTKLTWSREISRVVIPKCGGCHRDGGAAFPLTTYEQLRPWAKAIKEQVLERQMPPVAAVRGFSDLQEDESLTQEQIGLIAAWVEGGAPEGDRALLAPELEPKSARKSPVVAANGAFHVAGIRVLEQKSTFVGLKAAGLAEGASLRAVAESPDGTVTPLVWLYKYRKQFDRPYYFRTPLTFPAGTKIITDPAASGSIALLQGTAEERQRPVVAGNEPALVKQSISVLAKPGATPLDYVCPMDPDVRSDKPGRCPRCGMEFKLGIPDERDYRMEVNAPSKLRSVQPAQLEFRFRDGKTGATVRNFEIMHEKLFHLFVISNDLKHFEHVHPASHPDGTFTIEERFPHAGMYRLVADVYPTAGTPQLLSRPVFVPSGPNGAVSLSDTKLSPDEGVRHGENTDVQLLTQGLNPIAGTKTHLSFRFNTAEGMQMYLGAWAHMFIASDDTLDVLHEHPVIGTGGREIQFDIIFPRARTYRVWIQFQRDNVVNTVAVNIPVITLEQAFATSSSR